MHQTYVQKLMFEFDNVCEVAGLKPADGVVNVLLEVVVHALRYKSVEIE